MRRERLTRRVGLRRWSIVGVVAVAGGCSSPAKLVAKGGACTQAQDCEPGLTCVFGAGPGGTDVCSDDLSRLVHVPDAGRRADAAADADAALMEAGDVAAVVPDAPATTPEGGDDAPLE